jgi:hypothetical protein
VTLSWYTQSSSEAKRIASWATGKIKWEQWLVEHAGKITLRCTNIRGENLAVFLIARCMKLYKWIIVNQVSIKHMPQLPLWNWLCRKEWSYVWLCKMTPLNGWLYLSGLPFGFPIYLEGHQKRVCIMTLSKGQWYFYNWPTRLFDIIRYKYIYTHIYLWYMFPRFLSINKNKHVRRTFTNPVRSVLSLGPRLFLRHLPTVALHIRMGTNQHGTAPCMWAGHCLGGIYGNLVGVHGEWR